VQKVTLREAIANWSDKDLKNLWALLEGEDEKPSIEAIEKRFKWLYYSKNRARIKTTAQNVLSKVQAKLDHEPVVTVTSDELHEIPRYDTLIMEAAKHLKAYEDEPSLGDCELYLSHAVIISALQRMKPTQRMKFFTQMVPDELTKTVGVKSTSVRGPATAFGGLGLAQLSGFGIYEASTTALGFLTHAVGITLPFAAYTGLTSTIAYVIGPAGWLAAGVWGAWRLTQPKWAKIVPGLIYIVHSNARTRTSDA
jgi:hypothetical protein